MNGRVFWWLSSFRQEGRQDVAGSCFLCSGLVIRVDWLSLIGFDFGWYLFGVCLALVGVCLLVDLGWFWLIERSVAE